MDPVVARGFVDKGFAAGRDLVRWCADNAEPPARDCRNGQRVRTPVRPLAVAGVGPFAGSLKAAP